MAKRISKKISKICFHTRFHQTRYKSRIKDSKWTLKNRIRKKNPSIFHFNKQSSFIYEPRYSSFFIEKLSNKNKIKPSIQHIIFLNQKINMLEKEHLKSKFQKNIQILDIYKEYLNYITPIVPQLDERAQRIKNILSQCNKKMNISCRRLSKKYEEIYHQKISHTTINKILKKQLNYHFVKLVVKNDKLAQESSIKQTFFFLKIFLKCLYIGLNFIYIDESSIQTNNNNFRNWTLINDGIYNKISDNEKRNLLMAVSPYKTIYFEIKKNNTNSEEFKKFFENMLSKLSDKEKDESVFILDNLSSHATPEMFEYYSSKKLKVLFGVPYFSELNMIEFCFRGIKNILYKNIFSSITEVEEKTKNIILDKDFVSSYQFFFKETLNNYSNFLYKHKLINLNI